MLEVDADHGGVGTTTATNAAEVAEAVATVAAPPIATTWNADHIRVKIVKDCGDHLQVKIVKESGHDDIEVKIEKKVDGRGNRIYENNKMTNNTNTTCMEITISNWINNKKVTDRLTENVYNWTMFCAFFLIVVGVPFSDDFVFVIFFVHGLFLFGGMDLLHRRFNNTIITVHSTNGSTRTIISNNSNSNSNNNAVVVEPATKNEILVQTAQKKMFCPARTDREFHFSNFYQPDKKFSLENVHEIIAVEHEEFVYAVSILWYFVRSLVPRKNYCVEMIATTTTTTTDDDNDDNAVITNTILVRDLQDMETARYVQNQLDDFLFVQNHQDRYHRYIDDDDDDGDDKDGESNDKFNDEEEEMTTMKATTTTEILPLSSANNTTTELLPVFDNRYV